MDSKTLSIHVANYKCFGPKRQGLDVVRNINIIIGRNNCGKSALIDVVGFIATGKGPDSGAGLLHQGKAMEFAYGANLDQLELDKIFRDDRWGGGLPGPNHSAFGRKLVGVRLTRRIASRQEDAFVSLGEAGKPVSHWDQLTPTARASWEATLCRSVKGPWDGREFFRVTAERNVVPEESATIPTRGRHAVEGNGSGLTNLIQNYLNRDSLQEEVVRQNLLTALNGVMHPDAEFSEILVQKLEPPRPNSAPRPGAATDEATQAPKEEWEIFLRTAGGRFALSKCGSGLKTVLLVLAYFHVVLKVDQEGGAERAKGVVYAFEELENCLHPALLRRLLDYLDDLARRHDLTMFFTTHSNVMIDRFAGRDHAQIVHVTQRDGVSSVGRADSWSGGNEILDDLGCRASDLLQANGIIWVEGPSDRIYINKWIELHSDGQLQEGRHYQCLFYGGKLLAHLDGTEPTKEENELVSLLRVNRNVAIVMDSDRKSESDELNRTKLRIQAEVEAMRGLVWITEGREIENHVEPEALAKATGTKELKLGQYDSVFDQLESNDSGQRSKWQHKKTGLARAASAAMTAEGALAVFDLRERVSALCEKIRIWNGVAPGQSAGNNTTEEA